MTEAPNRDQYVAVPRSLAALAAVPCAVVTRPQLARLGFDRQRIRARVAAKRWQPLGRRVVILHNGPLSPAQQRWAAVLMLEQPGALAGLTAAAVAGLEHFADPAVHLVVNGNCDAAFPHWVALHNSRRFTPDDVQPGTRLTRTRVARSLIDAAAWSTAPRRACAILCAGVQQRLVRADMLTAELAVAGPVRHVAIMRAVLGDIGGGGHTLTEIALGPLARRAGLPPPRRQVLRRERGGRARYVDAEFDLPDGAVLRVEVDGAVHLRPRQWSDDLDRQNELAIAGGPMLRFDSVTVRIDGPRVIDQLTRMRRMHGG